VRFLRFSDPNDDGIVCGDGNGSSGLTTDTPIQGSLALEDEGVDRWFTLSTDSLRNCLFAVGGGSRLDRNPCTPRDDVLCGGDDAVLVGHETQSRMDSRFAEPRASGLTVSRLKSSKAPPRGQPSNQRTATEHLIHPPKDRIRYNTGRPRPLREIGNRPRSPGNGLATTLSQDLG
jgi:hypothetical protein